MKLLFTAVVIVALLLSTSFLQCSMAGSDFCDKKCAVRCSKTYRKTRCLQFCGICCSKCNCVPSGTVGNKSECACYANMRNTKGTSKCP